MSASWGTDSSPAPQIHTGRNCWEWCNHCAVCGVAIFMGARCPEHYGFYADDPMRHPFEQSDDADACQCGLPIDAHRAADRSAR